MSSDSEDDCYGNIAQRLQSMKNKYSEDKIETTNLLIADLQEKTDNSWRKNDSNISEKSCDLSQNIEIADEYSIDAIIAKNSKKRVTRTTKRTVDISVDSILPEKLRRSKRAKISAAKTTKSAAKTTKNAVNTAQNAINTSQSASTSQNAANTSQSNADTSQSEATTQTDADNTLDSSINPLTSNSISEESTSRGRARGRARGGQETTRRGRRRQTIINEAFNSPSRARGRNRRRGRQSYSAQEHVPAMYDFLAAIAASMATVNDGPVYSVGNTDEYPDQCDDQPLFNNTAPKHNDVIIVENETEMDENEELSVKVYWQSSEHVKFNIRRFQKLTQIFDYFAKRENVSKDKLLFTYNDKILKCDDTPDSINYSIVKFIDGGVVSQSVASIIKNNTKDDGIKLKIQCQNVKKPFLTSIRADDKMLVLMMKCAEHLEKPLDQLKFYFDGDLISGKNTAKDLELEGGECIDVKIIS